jgi:hypothetical protein
MTDLFAGIPVVADIAERNARHFSPLSSVPAVAGGVCLDAVQLRSTALVM